MAGTGQSAEHTEAISGKLARHTLRASLAASRGIAFLSIFLGLIGSWAIIYAAGGADYMVPHWYYVPILFAAVRFGPMTAFLVAVIAGLMAGPFTHADIALGTAQDASRWLSRAGFFIGVGQLMAWMVKPSLESIGEELNHLREEFTIRRALANNEFFLKYQPILSLQEGAFIGAEALIRWQHPTRGELGPAVFIGIAEQSSLINDFGDFVLEEACCQAAEWRELALMDNRTPWHIAINLSARDLDQPDLVKKVSNALKKHNLPAELLFIELTESALLYESAEFRVRQLKKLGVKIVLDDFGTGFSSLSYLHRFPVDILKIDRSLISELTPNKPSQALANGMVLLAQSLGLKTIAEGLETIEQLKIGKELKFDCVQGYYFAKPQMAEDIPRFILTPMLELEAANKESI